MAPKKTGIQSTISSAMGPAETLQRYRVQRAALMQKVIEAAEKAHPGIQYMLLHVDRRIDLLEKKHVL